jgi:hypothetical protein
VTINSFPPCVLTLTDAESGSVLYTSPPNPSTIHPTWSAISDHLANPTDYFASNAYRHSTSSSSSPKSLLENIASVLEVKVSAIVTTADGTGAQQTLPIATATVDTANLTKLPVSNLVSIKALPVNSLVLECNDASFYVSNALYDSLVRNDVFPPAPPAIGDAAEEDAQPTPPQRRPDSANAPPPIPLQPPTETLTLESYEDHRKKELTQRYLRLQAELLKERALLTTEERSVDYSLMTISGNAGHMKEQMEQLLEVEAQTRAVDDRCDAIEGDLMKAAFLLETRQVKLLGMLRSVFPITKVSDDVYEIRGLQIPRDYSNDDEHLSSALGFLAQLLLYTSKYLDIPLRYKLLSYSSRSAVQDGNSVYPLFKARQERERFDRATVLLERDVDSLISSRGVKLASKNAHILEKVDTLFTETISPQSKLKYKGKEQRRQQSIMQEAMFR